MHIAESVGIGHPDKIADLIADRLLEALLDQDINAQFACEVLAAKDLIVVAGEWSSLGAELDVERIVRAILTDLGYKADKFVITSHLKAQSVDIRSSSLQSSKGIVSGDQSIVVGYACDETDNYLPLSYEAATELNKRLEECIRGKIVHDAKYDSKSLVMLEGKRVKYLYFSVQHSEDIDLEEFRSMVYREVVMYVCNKHGLEIKEGDVFINSSERFVIGGLDADTGITNRKLMSDSYGTLVCHGGGGYSGKDLTKVDRLGAYYARWICKNMVAAGLCNSIELELIFHYGASKPYLFIKNAESKHSYSFLINCIEKVFVYSFEEIYRLFNKPGVKFSKLGCYGHFGRQGFPWEEVNKVKELRKCLDGI